MKLSYFAAAVAAVALSVFNPAQPADAATKEMLKIGVTNFADSLEPTDNYFGWVVMRYGLGECLVKFDTKMNCKPWLAKNWHILDDKLTWVFEIDDRAVFSNGNKVTGQAVADSIKRSFERAPRARSMFEYESITADGQKVIIKGKKPVPNLPGILGDPLFIIIDTTVKDRNYAKEGPICTGPYKVNTYTKALARMDRNEKYWDGEVPFDHVDIPSIDDPNTRAMALQSGEIDVAVNVASGDMALFTDKTKYNVSTIASLRACLGRLNSANGRPLADKLVRQALLRALDRETYCKVLLKDTFIKGGPQLPPSLDYGFDILENPNDFDDESAEKLLDKAGWTKRDKDGFRTKNGKRLEMDFVFYSGRAELPLFAEATQADAANVGIKVNLKNVDYNVLDGIGIRGEYDILISNILTVAAGDPEVYMNMYWKTNHHSGDPAKGSNPQNGSGFSNARYDELSDKLSVEFDPAKRRELIIEMQKIVLEEAATVIFGYPQTNMISNLTVEGAQIQPCDYYWLTKDFKPAK